MVFLGSAIGNLPRRQLCQASSTPRPGQNGAVGSSGFPGKATGFANPLPSKFWGLGL